MNQTLGNTSRSNPYKGKNDMKSSTLGTGGKFIINILEKASKELEKTKYSTGKEPLFNQYQ